MILLLEAENIVEFSTPADQRFEIVKAFNNVLGRADTAGYVRRYAYNETKNLSSVRDETRVRILLSTTLINVFHAQSQETLNSDFTHFILFALRQSLRYVTKEPELTAAEKQLIDDLRAYEKRVLELKGAQVAITRREIDGNTVNEYSGPDDKVRLMTLIKPLLDLLGQQ